jgi:hypothetical protein
LIDPETVREQFECEHLTKTAILLIRREDPIPVDLEARLVTAGIDVSELRRVYTPQ